MSTSSRAFDNAQPILTSLPIGTVECVNAYNVDLEAKLGEWGSHIPFGPEQTWLGVRWSDVAAAETALADLTIEIRKALGSTMRKKNSPFPPTEAHSCSNSFWTTRLNTRAISAHG